MTVKPDADPMAPSVYRGLARIRSTRGRGLYASTGSAYRDAIFGRDSLEATEDLIGIEHQEPWYRTVAEEVITLLARLQGTHHAPSGPTTSEEEPGKIHHEFRTLIVDGREIDGTLAIPSGDYGVIDLPPSWNAGTAMIHWGSVDATPLFVRVVDQYRRRYGDHILDLDLENKDGNRVTVRVAVRRAVEWIAFRLETSPLSLVEFQSRNAGSSGQYQTWKDSVTSHVHLDGSLANNAAPIAALEVQGLAYDALLAGARLFGDAEPDAAARWRELAHTLRQVTPETFWMADTRYLAMGLDRDQSGRPRPIRTLSSNAGALLDSGLLDPGLPGHRDVIESIATMLWSPRFLTDAGVRCRAVEHGDIVGFQDYHGSWTIWFKETNDIAKGLRRHGLGRLAGQLETRILNATNIAGRDYEFLYADLDGIVDYAPRAGRVASGDERVIVGATLPEPDQAWTLTAVLAAKRRCLNGPIPGGHESRVQPPGSATTALESKLLESMPRLSRLRTRREIAAARAAGSTRLFLIDVEAGLAWERHAQTTYGTGQPVRSTSAAESTA